MAQHDYNIANGTGAAVRSDLNNALAAIVSQNSGAVAPTTTYAYMPWADTTTGLFKIRNAANNGWITLYQLDGEWSTIALENGSAAAPSIYFKDSGTDTGIYSPGTDQVAISTGGTVRLSLSTSAISSALAIDHPLGAVGTPSITFTGDLNTGLWSPAADTIAASTGGTERLRIDSSGRVGVGNTAPSDMLHVGTTSAGGNIRLVSSSYGNNGLLWFFGTDGNQKLQILTGSNKGIVYTPASIDFAFEVGNSEKARLTSDGKFLVGTSTARTNFFNLTNIGPALQVEGDGTANSSASLVRNSADSAPPSLILAKSRSTSYGVVSSGDALGRIPFMGADGSELVEAALIIAEVDGTPGANDMPGRLVFSTTADGASSPTERLRINQAGFIYQNFTSRRDTVNDFNQFAITQSGIPTLELYGNNGSYANSTLNLIVNRVASSSYQFLLAYSGAAADIEFNLRGDGTGLCDGSWTGGGADYAEYFEWSDDNPDAEDRRGISVVLDGEKIRPAVAGEDPIGVISGNPSVVGDSAWNKWSGKYLRDDFGTYIQEDYEVKDEDGNTVVQQRRKLNPAYDPDQEYVSREQRPEWDCVGLMGKLRIRKGQPTGSRWIKMRDISDSVEEWLVR